MSGLGLLLAASFVDGGEGIPGTRQLIAIGGFRPPFRRAFDHHGLATPDRRRNFFVGRLVGCPGGIAIGKQLEGTVADLKESFGALLIGVTGSDADDAETFFRRAVGD